MSKRRIGKIVTNDIMKRRTVEIKPAKRGLTRVGVVLDKYKTPEFPYKVIVIKEGVKRIYVCKNLQSAMDVAMVHKEWNFRATVYNRRMRGCPILIQM